ncbi:MAG: WYL domain-containing protein [Oscillospiraceae bacterium]|nr:WYL domain-containing protein [Oscillospiraceae bacterium]
MAYSELIKNFNRVRDYMREFFVYGFKSREEYTKKSARSYDDERRRLESWLGDFMQFRQTPEGKNVFLSVDSRVSRHNPLYKAWKTKSFTDGDITLHFILFDILDDPKTVLTLNEIMERMDEYLTGFQYPKMFDVSTVRKKLNEYVSEGILIAEKKGRTMAYHRSSFQASLDPDALDYFSEVAPCGVIGSYLLDKEELHEGILTFKHHYITGAMDSEVLCALFQAMSEKRQITMETMDKKRNKTSEADVVPLRIFISVQNGRQYLMAYLPRTRRIRSFRTDSILSVHPGEICRSFDEYREILNGMLPHMWGVSTQSFSDQRMEHVEFTVRYRADESYIHRRLEREKRCGTVEKLDVNTSRFSADVYDTSELVPWIRTFLCRITSIHFSNEALEAQFKKDLEDMYALYGLEGGDGT